MKDNHKYTGYKEISMTESEMAEFYEKLDDNKYGCLVNEYVIVCKADGEPVDYYRWTGEQFTNVVIKTINNGFSDKIKPRNPHQTLAVDMLYNNDILVKLLCGKAGSGKSMLMIQSAIDLVKKGNFDKIVYVRNNISLKHTESIGALPGGIEDKLLPFYGGLVDIIGDLYLMRSIIEPVHLGFMRGRNLSNSIVLVNEAENLTSEHIELLVSRIAEGSQLWIDGDVAQVDKAVFETNNGLTKCVEILKGNPLFSMIELQKCERSAVARLTDLFH